MVQKVKKKKSGISMFMTALLMLAIAGFAYKTIITLRNVCGFSAGGHLGASLSTLWNNDNLFTVSEIQSEIYKPNASILCSAILTAKIPHCKDFLAAHVGGDSEKIKIVSCDEQVNEKTPPAFLYNTFEDQLTDVENVLYYAESIPDGRACRCE